TSTEQTKTKTKVSKKPKASGAVLNNKKLFRDLKAALQEIEEQLVERDPANETVYLSAEEEINNEERDKEEQINMPIPSPSSRDAPKFDELEPSELMWFLERMEDLFKQHSVAETDKKLTVTKYLANAKMVREWKTMPTYINGTWLEYKTELIKSYPDALKLAKGSLIALDRTCWLYSGHNRIESHDDSGLAALTRAFRAEAMALLEPPALVANRDLVDRFLKCLMPEFAREVKYKLSTILDARAIWEKEKKAANVPPVAAAGAAAPAPTSETPAARSEDRYKLDDIINTAREIADGDRPTGLVDGRPDTETSKRVTSNSDYVKIEGQLSQLAEMIAGQEKRNAMSFQLMQNMHQKQAQEFQSLLNGTLQHTRSAEKTNTTQNMKSVITAPNASVFSAQSNQCYYCHEDGHRMTDCVSALVHLEKGWIIRNEQGHLRLPGNLPIKTDGVRSRRETVEAMYRNTGATQTGKSATSAFLQDRAEISMGHGHYQISNEYNLSQNLMNLTREYGEDTMRRVMLMHMNHAGEEEEDEPVMGNFP
ncbi:hypothetical protein CVT25_007998, partial [Psilocybe cyanescens]